MATYKKNIVVDLKKNFSEKTHLIEKLKELINSNISNFEKIKTFKKLREKWVKIGKVQSHLSFGLNNSYQHHIKLFYDYIYLDKKIKEIDQENNKKLKLDFLKEAEKIKLIGDKLKSYRDLLVIIKKWNYLTGPVKSEDELKLNTKFDLIIQTVKTNKNDYLKNREKYDEKNIEIKKELVSKFKKLINDSVDEKNMWLKKISEIEKIKDEFIGMGPIKSSENNELWKEFKILNKQFISEKNIFFKNLKKTYSENINKQLKIIEDCKLLKEKEIINPSDLQNLKINFKKIKNVPYKRNKENWNNFSNELNLCFEKIKKARGLQNKEEIENNSQKNSLIKDLKKNFSINKIDEIINKWDRIGRSKNQNEFNLLLKTIQEELKNMGLSNDEIESHKLKVKSSLMSNNDKDFEKTRLRKKIEETSKQISQLENNLNFIKKGSDSKVLDGVHNEIKNLKNQLEINEKKYFLFK